MLATTTSEVVHSEGPILGDSFEHSDWYLENNTSNVGLQSVNSGCLIPEGIRLYISPEKIVQRCESDDLGGQFTVAKREIKSSSK